MEEGLRLNMKTLAEEMESKNNKPETYYDVNSLLKGDKKIVAFMGGSKSGTSFIVNNVAQVLAENGVNVAILDTSKDKDSYYIYTKNEESLRDIASSCIKQLVNEEAKGIIVNKCLTVYTAVPGDDNEIKSVEPILETLLKNHSLILLDCDFKTPIDYFKYATEIYLVQTMDILTIQPLTEILAELKNKGILDESKLRIILNKYFEVEGITEKKIIGGMSYYNDPSMAYMKELFNRNNVPYMTIPFNQRVYEEYLLSVVNCNINLENYPYDFIKILEQLAQEIYPSI